MKNIELLRGDCLDILDSLPIVDCVITSPPYNIGKKYLSHDDNMSDYIGWLVLVMKKLEKISSCIWINLGYRKTKRGNIPISYEIWDKIDMFLVQSIKWEYGAGMTYKKRFNHRSEDWLWFVKDKNNYVFNPDTVRDLSLTKYKNDKRNNPNGKLPGDIWYYPHVAGNFEERKEHPAQYPESMIQRIMLASTHESMLVLDPFLGSGTTGVVAKRLNRKFIGIEKDEKYFNIAKERIKNK